MDGEFARCADHEGHRDVVKRASPLGQRQGRHARSVARIRNQESVRQSRLHRIAVPERLARRYRLRAGTAGSLRDRHGRRLCAGHPQCRFRQPAFGRRRRQRARQYLYRAPQPDADGDHRRPAGAQPAAAAGFPAGRARLRISAALCEIQRRAGARRRRAGGDRARLLRGDAAALRADLRVGADRRLDPSDPAGSRRAASAANSAPIRMRCGHWPLHSPKASALLSWSVPPSIARRRSI